MRSDCRSKATGLNSDAEVFGGSGVSNGERIVAGKKPKHGQAASATLVLPPLGFLALRLETKRTASRKKG